MEVWEAIRQSFTDPLIIWGKLSGFLPNLIAAMLLIIVGHFLGKLLAAVVTKLLQKLHLDKLGEDSGLSDAVANAGIKTSPSAVLGKIFYWLIFLTFIISAADTLGLERVSETIDDFVLYLPKVIGAVMVMLVGLFIAGLVRAGVVTALGSMSLGYEKAIGSVIYGLIVVVVVSLADCQ